MMSEFPASGMKIKIDKAFVGQVSTKVSLTLAIDRGLAPTTGVKQFRIMLSATQNFAEHIALLDTTKPNNIKSAIFDKNTDYNFADFSVDLTKISPTQATGVTGGLIDHYKLGTYTIFHTVEDFNKENLILACMQVPAANKSLRRRQKAIILGLAPATGMAIKQRGVLYPDFIGSTLATEQERRAASLYNVVFRNFLDEQGSFLDEEMLSMEMERGKDYKKAFYSDIMFSSRNKELSFLFFFNLKEALSQNTNLFSRLSSTYQQKAINGTRIYRNALIKKGGKNNEEVGPLRTKNFSGIPESVFAFSGTHKLDEYTENLVYNYTSEMSITNGLVQVVEELQEKVSTIYLFRNFMENIFRRPFFYNQVEDRFIAGSFVRLREDLFQQFAGEELTTFAESNGMEPSEAVEKWIISVFRDIMSAAKKYDSLEQQETMEKTLQQLERLILLYPETNNSEYSFELFFSAFDNIIKLLNSSFANTGFFLADRTHTKNNVKKDPAALILKLSHDFAHTYKPSTTKAVYSYLPNRFVEGNTLNTTLPVVRVDSLSRLIERNTQKYYNRINTPPTVNSNLEEREAAAGIEGTIEVKNNNYLTPNSVRTIFGSNYNLSRNFDWDPKVFLVYALNIVLMKRKGRTMESVNNTTDIDEALMRLLKEVFADLSFFGNPDLISLLPPLLGREALGIGLGVSDSDEVEEEEVEAELSSAPEQLYLNIAIEMLENMIENPNSYTVKKINTRRRTRETLARTFLRQEEGKTIHNNTLPYPLYALYQNMVFNIQEGLDTNFFWGTRRVVENPFNASLLRMNFANIGEIRVFAGFETLEDGSFDITTPTFELRDPETLQGNEVVLCKIGKYNFGSNKDAWYLNNNNMLSLPTESEHFILFNPLSDAALDFFRGGARTPTDEEIAETVGTAEGEASRDEVPSSRTGGRLNTDGLVVNPIEDTRG